MSTDPADLANLRDIAMPAPIPYWPPAPGWWIVGLVLVAAVAIGAVALAQRHRANRYRRAGLLALDGIGPIDRPLAAQQASEILKRAALVAYPRSDVAGLSGGAWLAFLDRTGATDAFVHGPGRSLPALALGAQTAVDADGLTRAARNWLKGHKREAASP